VLEKARQIQKAVCCRLLKDKNKAKHRKDSKRLAKPENPHKKLTYGFKNEISNPTC